MLRLAGAILLLAGLGWAGWSAGLELRRAAELLRELAGALELMRRELAFRLTPLPELCDLAGRDASKPLAEFFAACARCARSGEEPFQAAWRRAAEGLEGALPSQAVACLIRLGGGLGRCDSEGETRLLEAARVELEQILTRAEEDYRRRGRLYSALGLTAGAFLVILLI